MSVKTIVRQQYRSIVDNAAASLAGLKTPPEGWLRTVRNALGMSGAELAKKMGVTRARVTQAEHAELTGGITLKSMQATAEAMGCRFVYAIIPSSEHIEDIITAQARKKAMAIVGTASTAHGPRKPEIAGRQDRLGSRTPHPRDCAGNAVRLLA